MKHTLLLGCLILLGLSACQKDNLSTNEMLPLEVGNEWQYRRSYYNSVNGTVPYLQDSVVIRVLHKTPYKTTIHSTDVEIFYNSSELRYEAPNYYIVDGSGNLNLFLKDDALPGDTVSTYNPSPYLNIAVGISHHVKTPAGSFHQVKTFKRQKVIASGYHRTQFKFYDHITRLYYQPGVGLVKVVREITPHDIRDNSRRIELELISCTLK